MIDSHHSQENTKESDRKREKTVRKRKQERESYHHHSLSSLSLTHGINALIFSLFSLSLTLTHTLVFVSVRD